MTEKLNDNTAPDVSGKSQKTGSVDEKEFSRLKEREKRCPTMLESEARALLRALQEIADILKLPKDVSPHQVVEHVRGLKPNANHDGRRIRRTVDGIVGNSGGN